MTAGPAPQRILLVTGLSGAGKSTALRTLEDLGWEVVDNLPLSLLEDLLQTPLGTGNRKRRRPLALGVDSRTRDFDANRIVQQIKALATDRRVPVETLYFDCAGSELLRRYSETRRRHPLAPDRPATDGIAAERELMEPLRRWADHVVDTTDTAPNALQQQIRQRFGGGAVAPTLSIMSFGFARGVPRNADNVFDLQVPEESLLGRRASRPDRPRSRGRRPCRRRPGLCRRDRADRGSAARPAAALRRGRKILCHDRLRLYRRKTPLGPRRRASR